MISTFSKPKYQKIKKISRNRTEIQIENPQVKVILGLFRMLGLRRKQCNTFSYLIQLEIKVEINFLQFLVGENIGI